MLDDSVEENLLSFSLKQRSSRVVTDECRRERLHNADNFSVRREEQLINYDKKHLGM